MWSCWHPRQEVLAVRFCIGACSKVLLGCSWCSQDALAWRSFKILYIYISIYIYLSIYTHIYIYISRSRSISIYNIHIYIYISKILVWRFLESRCPGIRAWWVNLHLCPFVPKMIRFDRICVCSIVNVACTWFFDFLPSTVLGGSCLFFCAMTLSISMIVCPSICIHIRIDIFIYLFIYLFIYSFFIDSFIHLCF